MHGTPPRNTTRPRRGFTLIEMLTVIVIILILLGLGVAVGPKILGLGEEVKTKSTLKVLEMINDEYTAMTGGPVKLDPELTLSGKQVLPTPFAHASHFSTAMQYWHYSIQYFTYKTYKIPDLQPLYAKIAVPSRKVTIYDPRHDNQTTADSYTVKSPADDPPTTDQPSIDIPDAWEQPIIYKQAEVPGTVTSSGNGTDPYVDWIPSFGKPYFASAGPDMKIGSITDDRKNDRASEVALDNIYSPEIRNEVR